MQSGGTIRVHKFQHTAARRRLATSTWTSSQHLGFNTQPPEGGWQRQDMYRRLLQSFNTQPPEGGWLWRHIPSSVYGCFNTQPPEGGWNKKVDELAEKLSFQHTAARRRLGRAEKGGNRRTKFQHTAARRRLAASCIQSCFKSTVSTHSRPKAAGRLDLLGAKK